MSCQIIMVDMTPITPKEHFQLGHVHTKPIQWVVWIDHDKSFFHAKTCVSVPPQVHPCSSESKWINLVGFNFECNLLWLWKMKIFPLVFLRVHIKIVSTSLIVDSVRIRQLNFFLDFWTLFLFLWTVFFNKNSSTLGYNFLQVFAATVFAFSLHK